MKKRWLSLLLLFCFSIAFVGGCKDKEESPVDGLKDVNGSDVVLKVWDKEYTADQLFADMLKGEIGAQTAYEKILRMVVESTIPVDANMNASWELMLDAFEEEVESTAASGGISEDEARKQLLAEDGYSSVEDKKNEYLYGVRLSKLQDKYWDEVKADYYDEYLETRMPYYVKHVLVTTNYTEQRGAYASVITSSQAKALYNVYDWLVKGYDFSQVMNEYSADNSGSTSSAATGNGYHMDLTTPFESEYLYGVFAFDALLKGKTTEVVGMAQTAAFYSSKANNGEGYDFGVINASDVVSLGDNADEVSSSDYENVKVYDDENAEENDGYLVSAYTGSSSSYEFLFNNSIVFNQTFNRPGVSVIAYDLDDDKAENTTTININGKDLKVLTDENGNIVFVVAYAAAKSSSDSTLVTRVHFLTVNVSPFDTFENTNGKSDFKLFYSVDKEATIKEMVATKRAALTEEGKTGTELDNAVTAYETSLKKYRTYIEEMVKDNDTLVNRNKIIDELEGYAKTYAQRALTSDIPSGETVAGDEQYLTYAMVEHYMKDDSGNYKIEIVNEQIKKVVQDYIQAQKDLIDYTNMNSIVNGWNDYYEVLVLNNSEEILSKKVPMECSAMVNGTARDNALCKYTYGVGFEILMRYMDGATELTVANEYKSYKIGEDFTLPTPEKTGFVFEGWYTDSELTKPASIDFTRTSTNNKTQLYAKWSEVEANS